MSFLLCQSYATDGEVVAATGSEVAVAWGEMEEEITEESDKETGEVRTSMLCVLVW